MPDVKVPAPELAAGISAAKTYLDANVSGFARRQIPDHLIEGLAAAVLAGAAKARGA
jgi:hypothetical protein